VVETSYSYHGIQKKLFFKVYKEALFVKRTTPTPRYGVSRQPERADENLIEKSHL